MTFQAWKMVFLNSMTFHDQGHPVKGDRNAEAEAKTKAKVKAGHV